MNKKIKFTIAVSLVIVLFALAYFAYGDLKDKYNFGSIGDKNNNQVAPDFTLKNIDGEEVSLSDYIGKPVVLNFWASWCPPCQEEMPNFNELSQQYEKTGEVAFLMVNLTDGGRETIETATGYLNDNDYKMNVIFDVDGQAAKSYNITSIPATFFIDSKGYINNSSVGSLTMTQLEMEVKKLLTLN
jgi:thiol-disulfide isomerase/thioredoxin